MTARPQVQVTCGAGIPDVEADVHTPVGAAAPCQAHTHRQTVGKCPAIQVAGLRQRFLQNAVVATPGMLRLKIMLSWEKSIIMFECARHPAEGTVLQPNVKVLSQQYPAGLCVLRE